MLKIKKDRAIEIVNLLKQEYPEAKVALNYSNPWELLVATILSAQATDKKVNEVTSSLFKKYSRVEDYAKVPVQEFEQDIKSIGIYRNKAKYITSAAGMIVKQYNSKVPHTMEEMLNLPGVARKTANIVLGNAYGAVEGIAVDTHVKRLSNRLGLVDDKNPDEIEKKLMEILPKQEWFKLNYLLIEHGRAVCKAKKPLCDSCVLNEVCPSAFQFS